MVDGGASALATAQLINMGVSFASSFLSGASEAASLKAEIEQYRVQAEMYRRNAAITRLNGSLNENISRSQQRLAIAQSQAAAGEAGMGESPTTVTALASSYSVLEQNILNDRYQVESEAENYLYQARVAEANMRQLKKNSSNKFMSSVIDGTLSAVAVKYGKGLGGGLGYGK